MIITVPFSVSDRHVREDKALANAMRTYAKRLVREINHVRGDGYLFLSECVALGFFMLFERMPRIDWRQRADLGREVIAAGMDVDGYARLVLRLEEMSAECRVKSAEFKRKGELV